MQAELHLVTNVYFSKLSVYSRHFVEELTGLLNYTDLFLFSYLLFLISFDVKIQFLMYTFFLNYELCNIWSVLFKTYVMIVFIFSSFVSNVLCC